LRVGCLPREVGRELFLECVCACFLRHGRALMFLLLKDLQILNQIF